MFGSFYYPSCIFGELYLARLTALYQSIRSLWSTHHLFLRWLSQLHCHDRCDSQMTEQLYGLLPGCVSPSTLYSRTSAFIQQHGHMLFESKKLVVYCVKAIWYCDVINTATISQLLLASISRERTYRLQILRRASHNTATR